MDGWNADLILCVVTFLDVKTLNRFSQASCRCYYLVHQYRERRGPELVVATSHIPGVKTRQNAAPQVVADALSRLQSPPNLALGFGTHPPRDGGSLAAALPSRLPGSTVVLHAVADAIQSSADGHVECQSHSSLLLANLPRARARGFQFDGGFGPLGSTAALSLWLDGLQQEARDVEAPWKAFFVYAHQNCAPGDMDEFVNRLQAAFPEATVVGGVCQYGCVTLPVADIVARLCEGGYPLDVALSSMTSIDLVDLMQHLGGQRHPAGRPKKELVERVRGLLEVNTHCLHVVDQGIFGVALAGDVPMRSMVSRGVQSLAGVHSGTEEPSRTPATHLTVDSVDFFRPGDEGYIFPRESFSYHLVRSVRDLISGQVLTPMQMLQRYGEPDFIGVQRTDDDGFELNGMISVSSDMSAFVIPAHGRGSERTLQDACIDFFVINGPLSLEDVESKVSSLQSAVRENEEQILGAVMFSCHGRGPKSGWLIKEAMADATRFASRFPTVPLLGYYAVGEIGPQVRAGRISPFQVGNSTLQGYTVVFAVFMAPVVDLAGLRLDDTTANVDALVRDRLRPSCTR